MSDTNASQTSDGAKVIAAIETLSNMTDFMSFKSTMLAKQAS